ncbi:protein-glutamate O-methyltransferase CheR [Bacillus cytotoxicus]|uniref:CheR family methyltransferase n=1 Tax=Bacillus cytotoxicus TaxID=580165 RepID=UPI00244C67ED|nr:protein-glutamate O-methyltransferase CheR [Bacillus cytotoxicus]MDH2886964.1 protein-glutamate O-methyltransferase CheR [Bacillus cytotoxicus]
MINEQNYNYFITSLKQQFHIDISLYKQDRMRRRIDSFLSRKGFENYTHFINALRNDQELFTHFIDHITINVSEFFRNKERWQTLETKVLPKLLQQNTGKLKAWSAACAAGEEPYTLSLILSERLPAFRFEIQATDLDFHILEKAKQGQYTERSLKELPDSFKNRHFIKENDIYTINPSIKQQVTFKQHDLLTQSFDTNFDLIICRNVMIYFTEEARALLYDKFSRSLKKGGVLFVGSTEQILTPERYNLQRFDTFFYEKI